MESYETEGQRRFLALSLKDRKEFVRQVVDNAVEIAPKVVWSFVLSYLRDTAVDWLNQFEETRDRKASEPRGKRLT